MFTFMDIEKADLSQAKEGDHHKKNRATLLFRSSQPSEVEYLCYAAEAKGKIGAAAT